MKGYKDSLSCSNPEYMLYLKRIYEEYCMFHALVKSETERIQFPVSFLHHRLCLFHNDHPDRCLEALPLLVYPIVPQWLVCTNISLCISFCVHVQHL